MSLKNPQFTCEQKKCLYCVDPGCNAGCPCGVNPRDFLKAAELKRPCDYQRSCAMIYNMNPLAHICALVCPGEDLCQKNCARGLLDAPISIPKSQAHVISTAKELGRFPHFVTEASNGKRVAIVGGGPAGLGATACLARRGYEVDLYESSDRLGGQAAMIPEARLPSSVLKADIDFVLSLGKVNVHLSSKVTPAELARKPEYCGVLVCVGKSNPLGLDQSVKNGEKAITAAEFLSFERDAIRAKYAGKRVAVIGGGAVAVDAAAVLAECGAEPIVFYRRASRDMPITNKERTELLECAEVVSRTLPDEIMLDADGNIAGLGVYRVQYPPRGVKGPAVTIEGSRHVWADISGVIVAAGFAKSEDALTDLNEQEKSKIFCAKPVGTVVAAVGSGKAVAHKFLTGETREGHEVELGGYNFTPVDLSMDFFGIKRIPNPFLLSASPLTDGLDECRRGLKAGWGGVVLKTAFNDLFVHVPNTYMAYFGDTCHGNCDNVSGRPLSALVADIAVLKREFPDRLIAASTGGPVFGSLDHCREGWQQNTKILEEAGAEFVEYSLSCPQGGLDSDGDIAAQSIDASSRIIRWVLSTPGIRKDVPKIFKMTGAVTNINPIIKAVRAVFDEFPGQLAGITLANSFPTADFVNDPIRRAIRPGRRYEDAICFGMSGAGVRMISNYTLSCVSNIDIHISGNGGVVDYKSAADFIALGARTVQFCALPEERGVRIVDELKQGLSHYMADNGFKNIDDLYRAACPEPILGFMENPDKKQIAYIARPDDCINCKRCEDCPYLAITVEGPGKVIVNPDKCVSCSLCTRRCPGECLEIRDRTETEPQPLIDRMTLKFKSN